MLKETAKYFETLDKLSKAFTRMPKQAGVLAVNHSKQRFREQAWLDKTKEPWTKRKFNQKGRRGKRGVLVDTGRLKRSVRIVKITNNSITIGSDVPYAQIHNEGGNTDATFNIRKHTRKAHTRKRKGRTEKVKAHSVKAHSRKVNINIPQRQFLGASFTLENNIQKFFITELTKIIT